MLDKAIMLASYYHYGQKDKGDNPYILHPLAVMTRMKTEDEKIVAVLHDIVEDTEVTFRGLKENGFQGHIIGAVDSLTRREDETYKEFIERASKNELARKVKIADIRENMDITRIPNPTENDISRLTRYKRALKRLEMQ